MAKKNKINLKYGYTLIVNEDDTLTIQTYTENGELIEFSGKNGNLMDASDFESWFDDEKVEMTLAEMKIAAYSFFKDWGICEDTANALVEDLASWFEKYAISEGESIAKKIKELESWIEGRRKTIAKEMVRISEHNKQITELTERVARATAHVLEMTEQIENLTERIAELKGDKFISVEPCYTGGGIYIFSGRLADDTHFIADSSFFDVRILNANPNEIVGDGKYMELAMDSTEWQEEHLVRDLKPEDAAEFFKQMLGWVKDNEPNGNYNMGDIDDLIEEVESLHGNTWR